MKKLLYHLLFMFSCLTVLNANAQTQLWKTNPFDGKVFIQNMGQFHSVSPDSIYYACRTNGGMIYFTNNGILYRYAQSPHLREDDAHNDSIIVDSTKHFDLNASWVNSNASDTIVADSLQSYYYTYAPAYHVLIYKRLTYHSLYNGIDAVFTFTHDTGFTYSLIVHPGANLSQVKLFYDTASGMHIDGAGNMVINALNGELIDHTPVTHYIASSDSIFVHYRLSGDTESFFSYHIDSTKEFVVDPWLQTLPFGVSGPFIGFPFDVDYDDNGNVYASGGYPSGSTPYELAKMNSSGIVQWVVNFPTSFIAAGGAYGCFSVRKPNGASFVSIAYNNGLDVPTFEYDNAGNLVDTVYSSGLPMLEAWRSKWDSCHDAIIIGAGGYQGNQQGAVITNLTTHPTETTMNILGPPFFPTSGYNDMAVLALDPTSNNCFMASADPDTITYSLHRYFINYLVKCPLLTLTPTVFSLPDVNDFGEDSIQYGANNGFNGMAASPRWLYMYDGRTLARYSKITGVKNYAKNIDTTRWIWGGLDVDFCDNLYVGKDTAIEIYDSTLNLKSSFLAATSGQIITDVKLHQNQHELYACGGTFYLGSSSFVEAYSYTPPTIALTASGTGSCGSPCNGTVTAALTVCGDTATAPTFPNVTYTWSPGGQTTQTVTGLCGGTYTVTASLGGCLGTYTTTVFIPTLPTPTVTISSIHGNLLCCGGNTILAAVASPGVSYVWSTGATTSTITVTPPCGSNTVYHVTVKNSFGCSAIAFYAVTVDANLSLHDSAAKTVVCSGSCTTIYAIASGGTTPYTYSWAPGGATTSSVSVCPTSATTYTVTVTDADGCKDTASITINIGSPPPNITGGNKVVCNGSSVSVGVASPPPFLSVLWSSSPAGTFSCTGCYNPTFTPTSGPGIYTLTEVVTSFLTGCSATYTITVTVHSSPTVSVSGKDLACEKGPFVYCPTVTGGAGTLTYVWNISGGSTTTAPCPEGRHVTWLPGVGGTVELTVTDTNGCVGTDTLIVRGCCDTSNIGKTLDNDTLSKLTFPYPSFMTKVGSTFYIYSPSLTFPINGLIVVDEDLVIRKTEVDMGTNARIQVTPGHSITIDSAHLYACRDMWDGIYLEAGGLLDTLKSQCSLIEDAENAVVTTGGEPYFINNSILNKNYVGIKVLNFNGTFTGVIKGSYLSCDTLTYSSEPPKLAGCIFPPTLYPNDTAGTLKVPHAGHRSYAGIEVYKVTNITIGNPTKNVFQDMDYGIISRKSNMTEKFDEFLNMDSVNAAFPKRPKANTNFPAGILAFGDSVGTYTVRVGVPIGCTFKACKYGVWVRDTINALVIRNNIAGSTAFTSAFKNIGINFLDNEGVNLTADSNTITNNYIGINSYHSLSSKVKFDHNNITGNVLWANSFGIDINEVSPSPFTKYTVAKNLITTIDNGIYALELRGANINDNGVTITGLGTTYNAGIYMGHSQSSLIANNLIKFTPPCVCTTNDGIRMDNGSGNHLICNTTDSLIYGLSFLGTQTPNTYVDLNNMNIPSFGKAGLYFYPPNTTIGHQGSPTHGTLNTFSKWAGPPPPPSTLVDNFSNAGQTTQFWVDTKVHNNIYPIPAMNKQIGPGPRTILFHDSASTDTSHCPVPPPAPALIPSLDNPLDSAGALGIIHDSAAFPEFNATNQWIDKQTLYDYLNDLDSSLLAIPAVRQFRDSVRLSNMERLERINRILNNPMGVSYSDLVMVNVLNHSLVNPDSAETIYQRVNDIISSMFYYGQNLPDSAQQVILRAIAMLCPARWGTGVYEARSLLGYVDSNLYQNICGGEVHDAMVKHDEKQPPPMPTIKVYPNPANTLLNVQTQIMQGEIQNLCIYNSLGQLVRCTQLTSNLTTVSTSDLAQGIYYYRVTDQAGNLIKADKQMIVH